MSKVVILVDNGHGNNTLGKCSPDGRYKEYAYTREIARRLVSRLSELGYDARLLVPELYDVSLSVRVQRVNRWCVERGRKNVVLVSIHTNAGRGDGWVNSRGWSVFVYEGLQGQRASAESIMLAEVFADYAQQQGWKVLTPSDEQRYWGGNFTILKQSICPAVLTENFFHNNKKDLAFLESERGKDEIVSVHTSAIVNYVESMKSKL